MARLCTLAQARAECKVATTDTKDDAYLTQAISFVSGRILEETMQPAYVPYIKTYTYDAAGSHIDDLYLKLDLGRPLLVPQTVIDAAGKTLVLNTDYRVDPQDSPYFALQRVGTALYGWSYFIAAFPYQWRRVISVAGIWGFRSNYPDDGWLDSLDTNVNSLNATTDTSIQVAAVNGADGAGFAPRFSIGNVIQIESEWCEVTAIPDNTHITVRRGVNGSTKAAHASGKQIFTWQVEPSINFAAMRWADYLLKRRGAFNTGEYDLASGKKLKFPRNMPEDVAEILAINADWRWAAV